MARRDTTDPRRDRASAPKWAWSWPANRRILYNRASADPSGKPWDPSARLIEWNGAKWSGYDVPDYRPDTPPSAGVGPFIMNAEGVGAPVHSRHDARTGRSPSITSRSNPGRQRSAPEGAQQSGRPRLQGRHGAVSAQPSEFPYAATTYRLTEHFHFWTKHALINAILQPEFFVEIGEAAGEGEGDRAGGWVRVWSKRGAIEGKAVGDQADQAADRATARPTHIVGIPLHWGFTGADARRASARTR